MLLHRSGTLSSDVYTLFDSEERVVIHPTRFFQHQKERRTSASTRRQTAYAIKQLCQWIEKNEPFRGVSVDEALLLMSEDELVQWINYQYEKKLSDATVHNREVLARGFYKYLTTDAGGRLIENIPWVAASVTKASKNHAPRYVTAEQMVTLLNGLHNESQRCAAHFLYDAGVRISELVRLTNRYLPNEGDWPDGVNYLPIRILGSKGRGGAYKERESLVSRAMMARINRYHSSPGYLLTKRWGIYDPDKPTFLNVHGERLTTGSVYKGLKSAWARRGRDPREVSPHTLRHGTAFSVMRSELGRTLLDRLIVVKAMLGHEDISTTELYASIPLAILQSLSADNDNRTRYEEAQGIYQATYMSEREHKERRGH